MTDWNAALEAYDEELEVIESLREEYSAFLRGVFDGLGKRLAESDGEPFVTSLEGEGPKTMWVARPRNGSRVALRAWAASGWGGPACTFQLGFAFPKGKDGGPRRRLVLELASAALKTLPGTPPQPGELDAAVLRVAPVSMKLHPGEELARIVGEFAPVAHALEAMVARSEWLEYALGSVPNQSLPEGVPSGLKWNKPTGWEGGSMVEIEQREPPHSVWVCARPPGHLILGYEHDANELHDKLLSKLGAKPLVIEGNDYVLLLDENDVAALQRANNHRAIRERAAEAFSAYFTLAG